MSRSPGSFDRTGGASRPDSPPMRVGLVGFGAVGRLVAAAVVAGEAGPAVLTAVLEPNPDACREIPRGTLHAGSLDELLATDPEVVVEVAGHPALRAVAEDVLRAGRTLVTISVGALADDAFRESLLATAAIHNGRLVIPSGAIGGLDALESARDAGLDTVTHTVRKPPLAILSAAEAAELVAAGAPRVLFEGRAREAARLFPENVNVVAAVSLAGIGLDRTVARVIADPAVSRNMHEVQASGEFGALLIRVENIPGSNPKTGRIVAPSVVRALRRLRSPLVLGG